MEIKLGYIITGDNNNKDSEISVFVTENNRLIDK